MKKDEDFDSVMSRLRAALGLSSDTALAERLGLQRTAFAKRKARGSIPREEIDALCAAAQLNAEWVYEAQGEPRAGAWPLALKAMQENQKAVGALSLEAEDARTLADFLQYVHTGDRPSVLPLVRKLGYVTVPRYDIRAAAGDGQLVPAGSEQAVDHLAFRPEWLREIGVPSKNLAVIEVRGDSMNDTLSDGDLVMLDTTVGERKTPGVYVLLKGDSLLIKRLHFKVNGGVEIRSDNKAYPTEAMSAAEFAEVRVVGRMVRRLVR